jgi:hypothetical protein
MNRIADVPRDPFDRRPADWRRLLFNYHLDANDRRNFKNP